MSTYYNCCLVFLRERNASNKLMELKGTVGGISRAAASSHSREQELVDTHSSPHAPSLEADTLLMLVHGGG